MPTITIPAGAYVTVPSAKGDGGIYINAVNGRSVKARIKFEDGTERDVSLRTVVVHAPTNQNTVLAGADKANKAAQSGEVQNLSAKVDKLADMFGKLLTGEVQLPKAKRAAAK